MQQRPLHQVLVRKPGLPALYAHCLTGITDAEPRMTITSHHDGDGWLWCIGGQLAGEGAALESHELTHKAQHELRVCLPWMDWSDAAISTFTSNRTEVFEPSGKRPDEAYATLQQGVIVCSPSKLTLAPDLGDRVLQLLLAAEITPAGGATRTLDLPSARLGLAPWENVDDLP